MSKRIIQDIIAQATGTSRHNSSAGDESSSHNRGHGAKSKLWTRVLLVLLCSGVVLAVFLLFSSSFSRVSVKVDTSKKAILLDESVSMHRDSSLGGIKYELMKFDDAELANIPSSGSKSVQKYAVGTVTIYNTSKTAQKLVIGTRIESKNGLIFKIDKAVNIPGTKAVNGKAVPGATMVMVKASATGAMYNIPASDFTVPGLKGGPKYGIITAKSYKDMTGGFSGEIKISSKADIEKARLQLQELIRQKLIKMAVVQVPKGFILYDDATLLTFHDNVVDGTSLASKPGEVPALKVSGVLNAIIIDENEIKNFVMEKKLADLSKDSKVLLFGLEKITFKIINKDKVILDGDNSIMANLSGSISAVWDFDESILKSKLVGIKKTKYQEVFREFPAVEKAEAIFSPSWAIYFPSDPSRIKIDKGF